MELRDLLSITFEREYSCNEGNLTWKIINSEVSEPSGLFGPISDSKQSFHFVAICLNTVMRHDHFKDNQSIKSINQSIKQLT